MWIVICLWTQFLSGAALEQHPNNAKQSRRQIALRKKLHDAMPLSGDPIGIIVDYDDGWQLEIEKQLLVDIEIRCMEIIEQRCLLAASGKRLYAFDIRTGKKKMVPSEHCEPITAMVHESNLNIITGDEVGNIKHWSLKTGQHYYRNFGDGHAIHNLVCIRDQNLVASASDHCVRLLNSEGREVQFFSFKDKINCLAFWDDLVRIGTNNGELSVINPKKMSRDVLFNKEDSIASFARVAPGQVAVQYNTEWYSYMNVIHEKEACSNKIYYKSNGIPHLMAFDDEIVVTQCIADPYTYSTQLGLCRAKKKLICQFDFEEARPDDSVQFHGGFNCVAVSPVGNFFAVATGDYIARKTKIVSIVKRVGDEVPEGKIDDEFVAWMEEPEVVPGVKQKQKKEGKPWYACW